jgi:hypothetical protein
MTDGPSAMVTVRIGDEPARDRSGILANCICCAGLTIQRHACTQRCNSPSFIVITVLAEITAIVQINSFLSPSPSHPHPRSYGFIASTPSNHADSFFIQAFSIAIMSTQGGVGRSRRLKVLGSRYGSGNGRRVCSLDVRRIGLPAARTKRGIVENRGVYIDESFANAIFNGRKVRGAQLVDYESVCC